MNITINKSTNNIDIEPVIERADSNYSSINNLSKNWSLIASNIKYTSTSNEFNNGFILEGDYLGDTIYRYYTSETDDNGYPVEDSFYSDSLLTELITTRNVNI